MDLTLYANFTHYSDLAHYSDMAQYSDLADYLNFTQSIFSHLCCLPNIIYHFMLSNIFIQKKLEYFTQIKLQKITHLKISQREKNIAGEVLKDIYKS